MLISFQWYSIEGKAPKKDQGPYIYNEDALSNIFCTKINQVDYSSHTIFIGTVDRVINSPDLKPLLYGSGGYL